MGNVVRAGLGQNPARQAALRGGLADHVAALTINKVCGSGLKAVMLAAQGIATGDIDIAVAGGMESMSNAPYLLPRVREGLRWATARLVDSMIHDGLWGAFDDCHMGHVGRGRRRDATRVGRERAGRVRRREPPQGRGARPRPAGSRTRSCPSRSRRRRATPIVVDRDEPIRADTTRRGARRGSSRRSRRTAR